LWQSNAAESLLIIISTVRHLKMAVRAVHIFWSWQSRRFKKGVPVDSM